MQQHIEFLPSRYLAAALVVAHAAAMFALLMVLPPWAGVASAVLLAASLWYYLLRSAWLRLGDSCIGLTVEQDGAVMALRDGRRLPGVILQDSVVTPALVVINLLPQGARAARSVVILPDSLDRETFRRLRVRLKWGDVSTAGRRTVQESGRNPESSGQA